MSKRILLIDDDIDDADLFKEALAEVDQASDFYHFDGCDALLSLIEKRIPLPDLIFLDINMPSLSGWKCLSSIQAEDSLRRVPIIMYTTSAQVREKQMAKELGASGFITKPSDFKLLKHILMLVTAHSIEDLRGQQGWIFEKKS